jgi:hypothetical protein
MTLPPVSLPSLAMLHGSFGWRTQLTIAAGVVLTGIVAGMLAVGWH